MSFAWRTITCVFSLKISQRFESDNHFLQSSLHLLTTSLFLGKHTLMGKRAFTIDNIMLYKQTKYLFDYQLTIKEQRFCILSN